MTRAIAILLALAIVTPAWAGATDIGDTSTVWSETDASNDSAPPGGWPPGMAPNNVEPSARANMGAVKRFWDRINPANSTTGSAGAYVLTLANTAYPVQYNQGEVYCAKANFASVGSDTLQINSLSALGLYVQGASGATAITANYIKSGQPFCGTYDSALNSSAGGFWVNQWSYAYVASQITTAVNSAVASASFAASQITSGTLNAARSWALTGDVTSSAGSAATTLATVNSNIGSFTCANVTVNGKGLTTAAANGTCPTAGRFLGRQIFCADTGSGCTSTSCTSGCTYTPDSGTNTIRVTVVGPGGGGGGAVACTSTTGSVGAPGGAGEVVRAEATSNFSGATATVPAGGLGGASTGGNGAAGLADASFVGSGSLSIHAVSGNGGAGKASASGLGFAVGGTGGSGGTITGVVAGYLDIAGGSSNGVTWTHNGGSNIDFVNMAAGGTPGLGMGTGAPAEFALGGFQGTQGAGTGYGYGGGAAGCNAASGSNRAGLPGGNAIVIVDEYS